MRLLIKSLAGLVLGAVAAPYLIWCWSQIAGRGIVFDPLFGAGLRGSALHTAIGVSDFVVSLLLLAPLALAIRALGRQALVQHTALAVAGLFTGSTLLLGLPAWPTTVAAALALISPCAALVAGVWLSLKVIGRAPDNSSKSTPLRGTA